MHHRAVLCALAIVLVVGAVACGGSSGGLRVERIGAITWKPCGNVQCATLDVPLDRAHPEGAKVSLALARKPATGKSLGVIFTNPGGPGGSGVGFLNGGTPFGKNVHSSFDIVSWDPRGIGRSDPVRCEDNLDAFYAVDRSPANATQVNANVDAARSFVDSCKQRSGAELPFVNTDETARDMDAIREAMGEPQITYVGFSYGTYLGLRYAALFGEHLRAMVLDGVIDPGRTFAQSTIDQSVGFEHALDDFFSWCRSDARCSFAHGGDPRAAYESIARDLESESVPATVDAEHRTLGPGEFDIGVVSALYAGADGYPDLSDALAQVGRGSGDHMLRFADAYTDRSSGGKYSSETAALYAIACTDSPSPTSLTAVQKLADDAARVAPHFGATTAWIGLPCTYWPVHGKPPAPVQEAGNAPILLIGNTRDPATPYTWAKNVASELRGSSLLTYDGSGHTAYGRGSACVDGAVEKLLRTAALPAVTSCSATAS